MSVLKQILLIAVTLIATIQRRGFNFAKHCQLKATQIFTFIIFQLFASKIANAQDGNAGINQANTTVRGYFDAGTNLMYAIGAVLGLIGAVKVYRKWNHGDHDTGKVAAAWFGS